MNQNQTTQTPVSREDAVKRFTWIKGVLDAGRINTSTRTGLVAEVAAFRELGYLTAEEAAPYLS